MSNTKTTTTQIVRSRLLAGKKLVILSIILLTTLSATVITNLAEPVKQTKPATESTFEKDLAFAKKLKLFNAKNYLQDYEHKKKAKQMLNESLKKFESSQTNK